MRILYLCAAFYGLLCVFSIVTGLIYASGKRKLNPLELSDRFVEKLDDDRKLQAFTRKMGWVTFLVGIVQGITSFAIASTRGMWGYGVALGFTVFSICSVLFKLKGKINAFPLLKLIAYVAILVVLIGSKAAFLG